METEGLGLQSGVADQMASAHGGINLFEVRYPHASVRRIAVPATASKALGERLVLVSLGRPHHSSSVHDEVIAGIGANGGGHPGLETARGAARVAAAAAAAGDLEALGRAMRTATEGQRALHPSLVSDHAQAVIDAAAGAGASGWKVNGAGGDGGSLTVLAGAHEGATTAVHDAVTGLTGAHRVVPVRLSDDGLRMVTSAPDAGPGTGLDAPVGDEEESLDDDAG